jgi:hypothetical protein
MRWRVRLTAKLLVLFAGALSVAGCPCQEELDSGNVLGLILCILSILFPGRSGPPVT